MLQRIEISAVQSLIDALRKLNYKVIGPTQRNGSIVYEEITSANQLPQGNVHDDFRPKPSRKSDGRMQWNAGNGKTVRHPWDAIANP